MTERAVTVIKQYGEHRTGTNLLRALLRRDCPQVVVASYLLGDKHSPPVDLAALWQQTRGLPDADVQFVHRATYARPGAASFEADCTQAREIRRHAATIAQAWREGTFGFVVHCKHPLAWAVSVARFQSWIRSGTLVAPACFDDAFVALCLRYNVHYRAWLALLDGDAPALVLRAEEMADDAATALQRLARAFGWPARPCAPLAQAVAPSVWDHLPVRFEARQFDASYYREQRYLAQLSAVQRRLVARTIDWGVADALGYAASG